MITATMPNHPNRGRGDNPARNPKPAEIRAAREAAELTQTQAAELVYVTLRAWQQWESDVEGDTRRMPAGLWELFRLKVQVPGLVELLRKAEGRRT